MSWPRRVRRGRHLECFRQTGAMRVGGIVTHQRCRWISTWRWFEILRDNDGVPCTKLKLDSTEILTMHSASAAGVNHAGIYGKRPASALTRIEELPKVCLAMDVSMPQSSELERVRPSGRSGPAAKGGRMKNKSPVDTASSVVSDRIAAQLFLVMDCGVEGFRRFLNGSPIWTRSFANGGLSAVTEAPPFPMSRLPRDASPDGDRR